MGIYSARPSRPFSGAEVLSFTNIPNKQSQGKMHLVADSIPEF